MDHFCQELFLSLNHTDCDNADALNCALTSSNVGDGFFNNIASI